MKEQNQNSKFSAFIDRSKEAHDDIHYRQQKIPENYLKKYSKEDLHIFSAFNTKEQLKLQLHPTPVQIQNLDEL